LQQQSSAIKNIIYHQKTNSKKQMANKIQNSNLNSSNRFEFDIFDIWILIIVVWIFPIAIK
jgi:hypothetical protein